MKSCFYIIQKFCVTTCDSVINTVAYMLSTNTVRPVHVSKFKEINR